MKESVSERCSMSCVPRLDTPVFPPRLSSIFAFVLYWHLLRLLLGELPRSSTDTAATGKKIAVVSSAPIATGTAAAATVVTSAHLPLIMCFDISWLGCTLMTFRSMDSICTSPYAHARWILRPRIGAVLLMTLLINGIVTVVRASSGSVVVIDSS